MIFLKGAGSMNLCTMQKLGDDPKTRKFRVKAILSWSRGINRVYDLDGATNIWRTLSEQGWKQIHPDSAERDRIVRTVNHETRTC